MVFSASTAATYWLYKNCTEPGNHLYEEVKDYRDTPTGFLYCVLHGVFAGKVCR